MTIDEVLIKQAELERALTALLVKFEQETGVSIRDVTLRTDRMHTISQRAKSRVVMTEVDLDLGRPQ